MPLRFNQFAERLAGRIHVAEDLAAVAAPTGKPAVQFRHLGVAQLSQCARGRRDQPFAVVVQHHRRVEPRHAVQHLEHQAAKRERRGKQRVRLSEHAFFPHVNQRHLDPRAQPAAYVRRAGAINHHPSHWLTPTERATHAAAATVMATPARAMSRIEK